MSNTTKSTSSKDELLQLLLQKIHKKGLELNERSAMLYLRYAMEIIELSELKGPEQKEMAIELLTEIINTSQVNDKTKSKLTNLIDGGILGDIVDLVVSATKGQINVNSLIETATTCCMAFSK